MNSWTRTLGEGVLIVAIGLLLGLAANAASPRGLRIDRDYFPRAEPALQEPAPLVEPGASQPPPGIGDPPAAGDSPGPDELAAAARLAEQGLTAIFFEEARATFEDPLYAAGAWLFIDARNDDDYAAGHIPGAYQFDHFHMERYLDQILQVVPGATRVVIYCQGGDCEDSEFAALTLRDFVPDPSVLRVYVGGVLDWTAHEMPLERGARGSGQLVTGQKP
jgi:rhodanese-related sulfurtransferase